MASCRLEFNEGTSSKFWACKVKGCDTLVTFGKIGTSAQMVSNKTHASETAAKQFFEKLKNEKLKKGYKPASGKGGASTPAPKAKSAGAPPKRKAESASSSAPPPKKARASSAGSASSAPPMKKAGGGKGRKVVDSSVPARDGFQVHEDFSVKLLQTNIHGDSNNNKYYIIQLLAHTGSKAGKFAVWNRWGRVGAPGEIKLADNLPLPAAMAEFSKKFREKTSNSWDSVASGSFAKKEGKYGLVETEDTEGAADESPLGKLTENQVKKGQGVLKELEKELSKSSKSAEKIAMLSGQYYNTIPTDTGFKKPPPLDTVDKMRAKEELLKFFLRMGFDGLEKDAKKKFTPIDGVMAQDLPKSLSSAALGSGSRICSPSDVTSSEHRAADVLSKRKNLGKLDKSLAASIFLYTGNAIYADLNKALREENRSKLSKYFPYLRLFLETFLKMQARSKRTVWRGVGANLLKDYGVGKTITWWGVSSTTIDKNVAVNFAGSCGENSTVFTIECESAIDISMMSFFAHEKECLLPPGTQFQVTSAKKGRAGAEIGLKEVKRVLQ